MIKSWIGGNDHEEKNRVSSFRGYLYKLRRSPNMLAPQWGRRWFSIEGHFLRWYRYETDLCAAGMVDLKYVKNIFKTDYMGPTVFTVDCEERTLVLKCSTTTEMNNWIRALHKQADIARGGSGTNLVSDFNQSAVDSSSIKYSRKLNTPSNSKSKMSRLEREIEETLKKLEALEQKVDTEDVDTATQKPTSRESSLKREKETRRRSEEEEMAKIDAEDTMEDSMGDSLTMDVPIRYAKGVSSSAATSTATTQKTYQQQQQHKTPSRSPRDDVDHTGSCSSIEDISLSASKVRRHREKVSKNSSKRLQYGEEPSPPQRHRDIVAGLTNSHNQEEDFIIIEEYPEEDSTRHSNRPMVGHKLRSNSHNNMTAAQNTRRQFLDLEDSHGNSQRRRGSGDSLDVNNNSSRNNHNNNNSKRSISDSQTDDRRSGTAGHGTFNQWQHQQQVLQHQSQFSNHGNALAQQQAVRRVSKRYEDEDDDDDVSDLLQVRTSKERLPGKFRTATTSSMNPNTSSSNNTNKKGGVKSVESTESLEFVEEDAQYGSAMFYGRHGRDAGVRSSNNANGHIGTENGSKGSKSSASNGSMNNVRTSKQFANLKPAWADS